MTKKKVIIISLISIFLLATTLIIYKILTPNKKNSIEKATIYLKNKIDNKTPYYTKITTTGDINNCRNCKITNGQSVIYGFYIAKALGKELNEDEKGIIFRKIVARGQNVESKQISATDKDLWGTDGRSEEISLNDADSTAYAMRALKIYEMTFKLLDIEYFYNKTENIFETLNKTEFNKNLIYKDNFAISPETNANIYNLFNETKQKHNFVINNEFVKDSQNQDGSFKGSYYPSKYYSTYLFLDFLCNYKNVDQELTAIKDKSINFVLDTQESNGLWGDNSYETSLALASLKSCKIDNKQIKRGEQALLKKQNKDGSWTSENQALWVFPYNENEKLTYHVNDTLATSLAIIALQ